MIHDPDLTDRLSQFAGEAFSGAVFRATRANLDPLAFSYRAGRWMPEDGSAAVLYTSIEREGALAEIAFHWSQLTPLPTKPISLHRLGVQTQNTLRLLRGGLGQLRVDLDHFTDMFYPRTQQFYSDVGGGGNVPTVRPRLRAGTERKTRRR